MKKSITPVLFIMVSLSLLVSASAQTPGIDPILANQYFQEAENLCQKDGGKLWGHSLCSPLFFVDRESRAVVANQSDKEGLLSKQGNVFVGKLPEEINIANTATEWAGVKWTMVMFPLPEDKFLRDTLIAHELWHNIQNEIGFSSSGAANNHLDLKDGRIWLQMEWRALQSALGSRGKARKTAIADALVFRSFRRSLFPGSKNEERSMEMHEGLAEYTGVKLGGRPDPGQYVIEQLKAAGKKDSFVRSFAYASGPVYGLLLDGSEKNWCRNLKKDDDFGILAQKYYRIKLLPNLKATAENRAQNYKGDALIAFETERENNHLKVLAAYRAKLVDGAVLEIPLQKMQMQFNPNNLVPLNEFGTVYPNIRIVDQWGILTVTSGGALMNPYFNKITITAPLNESDTKIIESDGWKLELNNNWKITAGKRAGDFFLKITDKNRL